MPLQRRGTEEKLSDDDEVYASAITEIEAGRRSPSREQKEAFSHVILKYFSGLCPCCAITQIVDGSGIISSKFQMEHWNGKHNVRDCDLWAVCQPCNLRLNAKAGFKLQHSAMFSVFQHRLSLFRRDYGWADQITGRVWINGCTPFSSPQRDDGDILNG